MRTKVIKKTALKFEKFKMQIRDNNKKILSKNFFLNFIKIDGVVFMNVKIVKISCMNK